LLHTASGIGTVAYGVDFFQDPGEFLLERSRFGTRHRRWEGRRCDVHEWLGTRRSPLVRGELEQRKPDVRVGDAGGDDPRKVL
jgi:hypothetical protein